MYRLLIVDDEAVIRNGLKSMIHWEEYGLKIAGFASDGLEALRLIASEKPDIVITDIKMPNMNGLELIKEARDRGLKLRSIVLSGYNDFILIKEAMKYGAENYLLKPVDIEELKHTLEETVNNLESDSRSQKIVLTGLNMLKSTILNRIVRGKIGIPEFMEKSRLADIDVSGKCMWVAVCLLENQQMEEEALWDLIYNIEDILKSSLNTDGFLPFVDINGWIDIICVKTGNMKEKNDLMLSLDKVRKEICTDTGADLLITVGNEVEGIANIPVSYGEALRIQTYRMLNEKDKILFHDDMLQRSDSTERKIEFNYNYTMIDSINIINSKSINKTIKTIVKYVEEHYKENISLKELSSKLFFNAEYIGRLFRNETGKAFSDYLNMVRIIRSIQLLDHTGMKTTDIAKSVGFDNVNYYYSIFKKFMGITPTEYRNKQSDI